MSDLTSSPPTSPSTSSAPSVSPRASPSSSPEDLQAPGVQDAPLTLEEAVILQPQDVVESSQLQGIPGISQIRQV